ncbi:MAG: hypothetical protein ABJN26_07825 [Stappiaceae bacterium]
MRFSIFLCVVLIMVGCGHVPVSSLLKLNKVDVLTVDPGDIRVAVSMPDGIDVRKGGGVLKVGVHESRAGEAKAETFILAKEKSPTGLAGIPGATDIQERIMIFKISIIDLPRIRVLQNEIAERKARYPDDVQGFLSVDVSACRLTSELPELIPTTTWLKTRNDRPFFLLTKSIDLRDVIKPEELESELGPCLP